MGSLCSVAGVITYLGMREAPRKDSRCRSPLDTRLALADLAGPQLDGARIWLLLAPGLPDGFPAARKGRIWPVPGLHAQVRLACVARVADLGDRLAHAPQHHRP